MSSSIETGENKERESRVEGAMGDFQVSELQQIERDIKEAESVLRENPDDTAMQDYVELARKKQDLFFAEHDNTGSYKFKRFGREVQEAFEPLEGEEEARAFEIKDGRIELAEGNEGSRMVFVNMSELDRFNKEGGGHAAGDAALRDAAMQIEAVVREVSKGSGATYELFRFTGNEFMLSTEGLDDAAFTELMKRLREAQAGLPENDSVEKVKLIPAEVSAKEVVEMLGALDPVEDGEEASRKFVGAVKEAGSFRLDIEKFKSRVGRMQEKIRAAGDDPKKLGEVEAFFKNYMKKMFEGTPLAELANLHPDKLSAADIESAAEEAARRSRGIESAKKDRRDEIIAKLVDDEQRNRRYIDTENFTSEYVREKSQKLATIPDMTAGQQIVRRMYEEALGGPLKRSRAEAGPDGGRILDSEDLAAGDALAALAEEAAEVREGKAEEGHREMSVKEQIRLVEAQIEDARRDRGTGLLERGEYYKALEEKLQEDGDVSAVFIDMGFLKYFDRMGGTDVGDAALKKGAELMTEALNGFGDIGSVKGEVYRYGGDEFTVIIEGGPKEVARFRRSLEALNREAGKIPEGRNGATAGYHPTDLVFNFGVAERKMLQEVYDGMNAEGGISAKDTEDPGRLANVKAELMTLIADKSLETDKTIDRFGLLIEAKQDSRYGTDPAYTEQVDNMVLFSQKALFSEAKEPLAEGMQEEDRRSLADIKLEEWVASGKKPEELRAEIEQFTRERVAERIEKEKTDGELRDRLVDAYTRASNAERKSAELQVEVDALTEQLGEEHERVVSLKNQIAVLAKEKEDWAKVRQNIDTMALPPEERAA